MTQFSDPYDLLGVTSSTGRVPQPQIEPIRVTHRIEWRHDSHFLAGWHGASPEPENHLIIDCGDADNLPSSAYDLIKIKVGLHPRVTVTGTGEGAASIAHALEQYRREWTA